MRAVPPRCVALVLLVVGSAGACQHSRGTPSPRVANTGSSVADSVRSLEAAWAEAIRGRDSVALDRLVAPDFTVASAAEPTRPPLPRAVWMANTLTRLRVDSIRVSPAVVTVQGDTAMATLHLVWSGQFMTAPPFRDSSALTDTWVRRTGRGWQVRRRVLAK